MNIGVINFKKLGMEMFTWNQQVKNKNTTILDQL